ncbi:MAG TPA: 5-formyltetrahydrofolate cyclo-ligase [Roseobacter sp.]|nr:5-formyltetrahydrofolate cyclo-ligase [Roseobacter sp.]
MTDDQPSGGSAPCFAHMVVGGYSIDPDTWQDVSRFRRAERTRLLAARALSSTARQSATDTLIQALVSEVPFVSGSKLAVYWPIRGEPDLREWMISAHKAGVAVLLPVVTEKGAPLEFHHWQPDCRMARGIWNILVPADGAPDVPDIVVSPLVGVDQQLYRLGNGGGYYDRTLALLSPTPRVIGVGFDGCRLPSVFPMPWDIRMDTVILSNGDIYHLSDD